MKKVKGSVFARQKNTIIALAVIFAVLLCAYIFIIRPLIKDDGGSTAAPISLIWKNEVVSSGGVMMFEHIERSSISSLNIHNPSLKTKYGESYVDWSIYRAPKDVTIDGNKIEKGELYLKGYEYAPLNDNDTGSVVASIINDAGFTLTVSRVVDHASDFSKYGLDFENEDDATYCEIVTTDGRSYKFYIGDKIPSGSAYYVRMAGKDVCLDENSEFYSQEIENDSVYIYNCAGVLVSPMDAVSPILTYPLNTSLQAYFDMFTVFERIDGKNETKIQLYATKDESFLKMPQSAFAQEAIYYSEVPKGYYSSTSFENLFQRFTNGLSGSAVRELAVLLQGEEDGKKYDYYGFDQETKAKYFKNGTPKYTLVYSWNKVPNVIDISELTENGTYYVYSSTYNTICEVSADTLSFLEWNQNDFIDKEFFRLGIKNCSKFAVSGKYFDFSLDSDYIEKSVNVSFDVNLDSNSKTSVSSEDFISDAKMNETERMNNFRTLFQLLLFSGLSDVVDENTADEIMNGEPFATISVSTREHTASITDPSSEEGEKITVNVEGMTRIYRFYKMSSGRCLMTSEDVFADGSRSEESGRFYMMTARVEQLLKSADMVANDELISRYDRY